ncbi:hypothetical protein [Streptomyces nigra]|uniref:hypothetical protein n=1 Tax=Streptomyces nigra TaxID=1827580 RepID=UPI00364D52BB
MTSAADRARRRVERVRNDTGARLALAREFYEGARGDLSRYVYAESSFMRWSAARGVLEPESADPPGSPWWRAVNEVLLRDKVEAALLTAEAPGTAPAAGRSGTGRGSSGVRRRSAGTARTTPASSPDTWTTRIWRRGRATSSAS